MKKLVFCFLFFCSVAHAETFESWKANYQRRAVDAGLSSGLISRAFEGMQLDERVITLDRKQPEGHMTLQEYVDKTATAKRVQKGQGLRRDYRSLLETVEGRYGVQPSVLLALWGKETDFGGYTGNFETISALATLAYEGRRRAFFEQELLDAIILLGRMGWRSDQMRGSWAGAVGQCQFMPSNYAKYAIDGNGDGKTDLWNSMSDVFHSMGHFLRALGWQSGQGWGQTIKIPAGFDKNLIGRDKNPHDIRFWEQRGVQFTRSVPPQVKTQLRLYQPDGPGTRAYAIYPNFDVLMKWNKSGYFATAVGVLADSISSP